MRLKKKWIVLGVIGLLVAGGVYAGFSKKAPAATVTTDVVKQGTLVQSVDATGTVATLEHVDLSFNASGSVSLLNVKVGQSVKAGETLASLAAADASADVAHAEALLALKRAGATVEDVKVSQDAVTSAQAALDAAKTSAADATTQLTKVQAATAASVAAATTTVSTTTTSTALVRAQAYDDELVELSKSIIVIRSAMSDADRILGVENTLQNDTFEYELAATNSAILTSARNAYTGTIASRTAAETAVSALTSASSDAAVTAAAATVKTALIDVSNMLLFTRQVLDATVGGSSTLSATDLQTFKTLINTARTSVSTEQSAFTTATQAWTTAQADQVSKVQAANDALATAQANADRDVSAAETSVRSTAATVVTRTADLASAQASLAKVQANPRSVDLASLEADVAAAQARYAKYTIVAPIAGIVTAVNVDLGAQVAAGTPAITVQAIGTAFEIPVDIPEADIAKLAVGNPATITLDAFGDDRPFTATVASIYPAEKLIQGVVFYEAKLTFTSTDLTNVKPGMSANVTIQTAKKDNALFLPQRAVLEEDGVKYVRVPSDPTNPAIFTRVNVTTGLRANDDLLEILSGVSKDETVILTIKS